MHRIVHIMSDMDLVSFCIITVTQSNDSNNINVNIG